ncbi:MAG: hypothetical protein ACE5HN_07215 [Nitrospiria bacterium]
MARFDFDRFNGFVKQSLDDLLFNDLWNLDIFNERDFHSAAYYYIPTYFRKHERSSIYVRCEPKLEEMEPDMTDRENHDTYHRFPSYRQAELHFRVESRNIGLFSGLSNGTSTL